jgi:hypothetical protein
MALAVPHTLNYSSPKETLQVLVLLLFQHVQQSAGCTAVKVWLDILVPDCMLLHAMLLHASCIPSTQGMRMWFSSMTVHLILRPPKDSRFKGTLCLCCGAAFCGMALRTQPQAAAVLDCGQWHSAALSAAKLCWQSLPHGMRQACGKQVAGSLRQACGKQVAGSLRQAQQAACVMQVAASLLNKSHWPHPSLLEVV